MGPVCYRKSLAKDRGHGDRGASYRIVVSESTPERLVIKDVGPWDRYFTVTNDAENVVQELVRDGQLPAGRRLFYYDSQNDFDEILVVNGKFSGFRPVERAVKS